VTSRAVSRRAATEILGVRFPRGLDRAMIGAGPLMPPGAEVDRLRLVMSEDPPDEAWFRGCPTCSGNTLDEQIVVDREV